MENKEKDAREGRLEIGNKIDSFLKDYKKLLKKHKVEVFTDYDGEIYLDFIISKEYKKEYYSENLKRQLGIIKKITIDKTEEEMEEL